MCNTCQLWHFVWYNWYSTISYLLKRISQEYFFRPDALSLIFISVLTITGIATIINSFVYFSKRQERLKKEVHLSCLTISPFCLHDRSFLSDNINILWILAEATTLCISMLIYHERTEEALEATWKYFFVSTVGCRFHLLAYCY